MLLIVRYCGRWVSIGGQVTRWAISVLWGWIVVLRCFVEYCGFHAECEFLDICGFLLYLSLVWYVSVVVRKFGWFCPRVAEDRWRLALHFPCISIAVVVALILFLFLCAWNCRHTVERLFEAFYWWIPKSLDSSDELRLVVLPPYYAHLHCTHRACSSREISLISKLFASLTHFKGWLLAVSEPPTSFQRSKLISSIPSAFLHPH
jgi:hypothetical protein